MTVGNEEWTDKLNWRLFSLRAGHDVMSRRVLTSGLENGAVHTYIMDRFNLKSRHCNFLELFKVSFVLLLFCFLSPKPYYRRRMTPNIDSKSMVYIEIPLMNSIPPSPLHPNHLKKSIWLTKHQSFVVVHSCFPSLFN